jgi:methyltransferase
VTDARVFVMLGLFVAVIAGQRLFELVYSARGARRLAARGGREVSAAHFPLLVVLHTLLPIALIAEVMFLDARPGPRWPVWLALWLLAQALRIAAIRTLGDRWNVRIWVVPGEDRVRRGIYRWIPHPNYLAIVIEIMAAPMLFGAWRTAFLFSTLNALVLRIRIRAEESALSQAERQVRDRPPSGHAATS